TLSAERGPGGRDPVPRARLEAAEPGAARPQLEGEDRRRPDGLLPASRSPAEERLRVPGLGLDGEPAGPAGERSRRPGPFDEGARRVGAEARSRAGPRFVEV